MMNNREAAIEIFLAGVESVKPGNLIRRFVSLQGNSLIINELKFDLLKVRNIFLIGAGKASALMALEMESILGKRISGGHIVTKYQHIASLKYTGITEAGHPVPDENGLKGTESILTIAEKAGKDDLVICLLSGGGSALMADIPEGCTLPDLKHLNEIMLKSGLDIREMNCIRKHISRVKGGHLAKTIAPATLVSLILSDVIGDPLDVIASGPTVPDSSTFADAIEIIKKYKIEKKIPLQINQVLQEGYAGKRPETLKDKDDLIHNAFNFIIGNNTLALNEAAKKARFFGYEPSVISNSVDGYIKDVADQIVKIAIKTKKESPRDKICLLFGGEPTIKVEANGLGGRNQHLGLLAAEKIANTTNITILSAGTDGSDGPTDAAGAVCDSDTLANAQKLQLDIHRYIEEFDSYNFFKKEGGLIFTGPTQTNVMDIMVVLVN
jgi:glycerate 2-kinase